MAECVDKERHCEEGDDVRWQRWFYGSFVEVHGRHGGAHGGGAWQWFWWRFWVLFGVVWEAWWGCLEVQFGGVLGRMMEVF